MVRLAASAVVWLIANAIALIVAAQVLSDFSLGASGFVTAVVIFTAVGVLMEPLFRQMAVRQVPALTGGTALVSTLAALIVTAVVGDSLVISGLSTWIAAVVIVWIVALVARLLLPLVIFKKTLANRRDRQD
ncbi:MAG: hypothetical protein KDA94_15980 [Acidimicrobiales bacterium]|nr:hypothetical protein [Acidimicrobiales bacterium]